MSDETRDVTLLIEKLRDALRMIATSEIPITWDDDELYACAASLRTIAREAIGMDDSK